jgi:hypothetical protein
MQMKNKSARLFLQITLLWKKNRKKIMENKTEPTHPR